MSLPYDKNLKPLARSLRTNTTDAERKLWSALRKKQIRGLPFTRQKTIRRYIVDFHCAPASLVIELDGGQHLAEEGRGKDQERDQELEAMGLRVLRFSDRDVLLNTEGVLRVIWEACGGREKPPPPPLSKGEDVRRAPPDQGEDAERPPSPAGNETGIFPSHNGDEPAIPPSGMRDQPAIPPWG